MHCVYVIQSERTKKLYFGYTTDIQKRIVSHNARMNTATKSGAPWKVVYCEIYRSAKDARERESQLKHYGNARTHLKRRIGNSLL